MCTLISQEWNSELPMLMRLTRQRAQSGIILTTKFSSIFYCHHWQNEAKEKKAAQDKENDEAKSQLDVLTKRLEFTEKDLDELRKV